MKRNFNMSTSSEEDFVNGEINSDSDIEMVEEVPPPPENLTPEK